MITAERLRQVAPSATLKLTAKAKEMKGKGLPVISYGAGEPDFDVPEPIKEEAIRCLKAGFTKYTPTSGIPELRQEVCRKFEEDQGLKYAPENVVISCGAKHSLYNLFQALLNDGDEVLIPTPYWVSYPEMVRLAGGKPVFVPTSQSEGFKVTPALLKNHVTPKTRVLILNSPSNPTGGILEKKDLEALAEFVVKHDLICVSDEIYEYYVYHGAQHVSIASFSPEIKARTFVVNGTSKSYSMTGLRIGYLAGDPEVIKKIGILQDHSTSNPVSISQKMAVAALKMPHAYRQEIREKFQKRGELMTSLLAKVKGFKPFAPEGAFYVFCDIAGTKLSSDDLCARLLEEKYVAIIPGKSFGSDRHVRLSFACSEKDIQEGLSRVAEWAGKEIHD